MAAIYLLTKVQEEQTAEQRTALIAKLETEFPDAWRDLGMGSFLVATSKPVVTQDVANSLGISEGIAGSYILTKMEPYYGYANKAIWEWVRNMKEWNEHS